MEDLTKHFPNSGLTTKQIRETIIKITGLTEDKYYFCYKCFKFLGENIPKCLKCETCYRFYCENCSPGISHGVRQKYIDTDRCPQCIENRLPL